MTNNQDDRYNGWTNQASSKVCERCCKPRKECEDES